MSERTASEANQSQFDVGGAPRDELFRVLSDSRRRAILHVLPLVDLPVSVADLTTELVAREARRPVPDRSGAERDTIEISLVHNHLPMMAEAGVIRYDDTRRTVTLADRTEEARSLLQTVASG